MGKTFVSPSNSHALFPHFEHWPTCSRQALPPAKNRVAILPPVSAIGSAANATRPKLRTKTFVSPKKGLAIILPFEYWQTCSMQQRPASQYYFRFPLGSAPNATQPKSMRLIKLPYTRGTGGRDII